MNAREREAIDRINDILLAPVPSGEVETPEAARAKAIDAMAAEWLPKSWRSLPADQQEVESNAMNRMLDALIAQGWTPPGTEER